MQNPPMIYNINKIDLEDKQKLMENFLNAQNEILNKVIKNNLIVENESFSLIKNKTYNIYYIKDETFQETEENELLIFQYIKPTIENSNISTLMIDLNNIIYNRSYNKNLCSKFKKNFIKKYGNSLIGMSLNINQKDIHINGYNEIAKRIYIINLDLKNLIFVNEYLKITLIQNVNDNLSKIYNFTKITQYFKQIITQIPKLFGSPTKDFVILYNEKENNYIFSDKSQINQYNTTLPIIITSEQPDKSKNNFNFFINIDYFFSKKYFFDQKFLSNKYFVDQELCAFTKCFKNKLCLINIEIIENNNFKLITKETVDSIKNLSFLKKYMENVIIKDIYQKLKKYKDEDSNFFYNLHKKLLKLIGINVNDLMIFFDKSTNIYKIFQNNLYSNIELEKNQNLKFIIRSQFENKSENIFDRKVIITLNMNDIKSHIYKDTPLSQFFKMDSLVLKTNLNSISISIDFDQIKIISEEYKMLNKEYFSEIINYIEKEIIGKIELKQLELKQLELKQLELKQLELKQLELKPINIKTTQNEILNIFKKISIDFKICLDESFSVIFNEEEKNFYFCGDLNNENITTNPNLKLLFSFMKENNSLFITANLNFIGINIKSYFDIFNFDAIIIFENNIDYFLNNKKIASKELNNDFLLKINDLLLDFKKKIESLIENPEKKYFINDIEAMNKVITEKNILEIFLNKVEKRFELNPNFNVKFNKNILTFYLNFVENIIFHTDNDIVFIFNQKKINDTLEKLTKIKKTLISQNLYNEHFNQINFFPYFINLDDIIINNLVQLKQIAAFHKDKLFNIEHFEVEQEYLQNVDSTLEISYLKDLILRYQHICIDQSCKDIYYSYNAILNLINKYSIIIDYDIFSLIQRNNGDNFIEYIEIFIFYVDLFKDNYSFNIDYQNNYYFMLKIFFNQNYSKIFLNKILSEMKYIYSVPGANIIINFENIIDNINNFEFLNKRISDFMCCRNNFLENMLEKSEKYHNKNIINNLINICFNLHLREFNIKQNQDELLTNINISVGIIEKIYNKIYLCEEMILEYKTLSNSSIIKNVNIILVDLLKDIINEKQYSLKQFNKTFNDDCLLFKNNFYENFLKILLNNSDKLETIILFNKKKEIFLIEDYIDLLIINEIGINKYIFQKKIDNTFKIENSFFYNLSNEETIKIAFEIYIGIYEDYKRNEMEIKCNKFYYKSLYTIHDKKQYNIIENYNKNYTTLKMIELIAKIVDVNKTTEENKNYIYTNIDFIDYIFHFTYIELHKEGTIKDYKLTINNKTIQKQNIMLCIIKDLNILNINYTKLSERINSQPYCNSLDKKEFVFNFSNKNLNFEKNIEISKKFIEEKYEEQNLKLQPAITKIQAQEAILDIINQEINQFIQYQQLLREICLPESESISNALEKTIAMAKPPFKE